MSVGILFASRCQSLQLHDILYTAQPAECCQFVSLSKSLHCSEGLCHGFGADYPVECILACASLQRSGQACTSDFCWEAINRVECRVPAILHNCMFSMSTCACHHHRCCMTVKRSRSLVCHRTALVAHRSNWTAWASLVWPLS